MMIFKQFTLALLLMVSALSLSAQSNTMYYLTGQPQAYYLNPASQPMCAFFLNVPLTPIYLEGYNNSIGFADLVYNDPNSDAVIHPFHPNTTLDDFFAQLENKNTVGMRFEATPLSFGFRVKDMYFTFDAGLKSRASISYSTDLMDFLIQGNENRRTYDFSGMGFHLSSYMEYALGISKNFNDMVYVGVRPKLLLGLAHIASENNDIQLYTSNRVWRMRSSMELQMAFAGVNIPTKADGSFDLNGQFKTDSTAGFNDILMANKGFGIDLGTHLKPTENLTLSFSAIDIGVIKWQQFNHTTTLTGNFDFEGLVYNPGDTTNIMQTFVDSLKAEFGTTGSNSPFTTSLPTKLFIGGSYAILPSVDAGALVRLDLPYMDEPAETNLMLHANWHPSRALALAFNYSPLRNSGATLGFGIFTRLAILSSYMYFDYFPLEYNSYRFGNVPVGIPFPAQGFNRFNIRLGTSIMIGNNQNKKLKKDKPMYYSEDNE